MKLKKSGALFLSLLTVSLTSSSDLRAADKLRIVTTTSTFASLAGDIAGDRAEIYSIASPRRNIHFISPTPKDVVKTKKADVFIHAGLDLEAWRGPLLDAAGRPELMGPTGNRQIDVSKGIPLLEVPTNLSRIEGDIHAYGNPHYWLDPENGGIIARNIVEGLSRIDPADADFFQHNGAAFEDRLHQKMREWRDLLAPVKGQKIVTYHKSWSYFAERFGLIVLGELEPKPGIPPTAKHLADLENTMRTNHVKVIIKETYFENRTPEKVAKETGAAVLNFAQAVGEIKEAPDYLAMIDYNVRAIAAAFENPGESK